MKKAIRKLQVAQRSMERCMIGITKLNKKRNQWIRNQTKAIDVIDRVKTLKWKWAGHVARRIDDSWIKKVLEWIPRSCRRPKKRPCCRWQDEIRKFAGVDWWRKTLNRRSWKFFGEAFILQWIDNG